MDLNFFFVGGGFADRHPFSNTYTAQISQQYIDRHHQWHSRGDK